jgi:hypothetical protein
MRTPRLIPIALGLTALLAACGETTVKTTPAATVVETVTVPSSASTEQTAPATTEQTPPATTDSATPADGAAKTGDTIAVNDGMAVTVLAVRDPARSPDQYNRPEPGNRWVAIKVKVQNTGDTALQINTDNDTRLLDGESQEYEPEIGGLVKPALYSPTIAPGGKRVGWVTFQVPKKLKIDQFQYTTESGFGDAGLWQLR